MLAHLCCLFLRLLSLLVSSLFKFVIFEVDNFLKWKRFFRVAITGKSIKDLGKFWFTYNSVLNLANVFISENNVCLVNSQLEGKEENGYGALSSFPNLKHIIFNEEWLRYTTLFLFSTNLLNIFFFTFGISGSRWWSRSWLWVFLLASCIFLVSIVLNLNIKHYILWECIFNL